MPTVKELQAMAKERGLKGYSGKRKSELENMLGFVQSAAQALVGAVGSVVDAVAPAAPQPRSTVEQRLAAFMASRPQRIVERAEMGPITHITYKGHRESYEFIRDVYLQRRATGQLIPEEHEYMAELNAKYDVDDEPRKPTRLAPGFVPLDRDTTEDEDDALLDLASSNAQSNKTLVQSLIDSTVGVVADAVVPPKKKPHARVRMGLHDSVKVNRLREDAYKAGLRYSRQRGRAAFVDDEEAVYPVYIKVLQNEDDLWTYNRFADDWFAKKDHEKDRVIDYYSIPREVRDEIEQEFESQWGDRGEIENRTFFPAFSAWFGPSDGNAYAIRWTPTHSGFRRSFIIDRNSLN